MTAYYSSIDNEKIIELAQVQAQKAAMIKCGRRSALSYNIGSSNNVTTAIRNNLNCRILDLKQYRAERGATSERVICYGSELSRLEEARADAEFALSVYAPIVARF